MQLRKSNILDENGKSWYGPYTWSELIDLKPHRDSKVWHDEITGVKIMSNIITNGTPKPFREFVKDKSHKDVERIYINEVPYSLKRKERKGILGIFNFYRSSKKQKASQNDNEISIYDFSFLENQLPRLNLSKLSLSDISILEKLFSINKEHAAIKKENTSWKRNRIGYWIAIISLFGILLYLPINGVKYSKELLSILGLSAENSDSIENQPNVILGKGNFLSLEFDYIILSEKYWQEGSSTKLEQGLALEVLENYFSKLDNEFLNNASTLIAVGMASEKGSLLSQEDLGLKRSDKIMEALVSQKIASDKCLYKLNLGKYIHQKSNYFDKSLQRRATLIALNNPFYEVWQVIETLDQLQCDGVLPINFYHYSKFDVIAVKPCKY